MENESKISDGRAVYMRKKKTPSQWLRSRKGQKVMIIFLFMVIPLTLLVIFTYLPFGKMVEFSFLKMKYLGKRTPVGWQNYIDVFKRDDIFKALTLSIYYMVASIVQLGLALYLATVLSFKTKGGKFFKGSIFFPYLISGIAVGFIFKFFYTRGFVFDSVLTTIGFDLENLPRWLSDMKVNNISLAATSVWRYMGQNMVLFIGAIMSVDAEMYEAADLDGASKWQKFKYIILPSISSIVLLNLILSISGSLSAFEPPFVITGGTAETATYFVKMHDLAHNTGKVGLACAMAVVLMLIIVLVTVLQKLFFHIMFDNRSDVSKTTQRRLRKLNGRYEVGGGN